MRYLCSAIQPKFLHFFKHSLDKGHSAIMDSDSEIELITSLLSSGLKRTEVIGIVYLVVVHGGLAMRFLYLC
jgi:succinate dehydrogenase/fumarate reductase cytochrome b subunit